MIEVHGHRGFRGRWPENSLIGFLKAVETGAAAIELDVVLSADSKVVVSHEPWMAAAICTDPEGKFISKAEEKNHNIFRMPYSQVCRYDCGSVPNPEFPHQHKLPARKPLLGEVIGAVEASLNGTGRQITYNIEVKSASGNDNLFYPAPDRFVQTLLNEIRASNLPTDRFLVQSFDIRILQECKQQAPEVAFGLLLDVEDSVTEALATLGFLPQYLNPDYRMVTPGLLQFCRQQNLKILPWTVNNPAEMQQLIDLGVDGLITDFPDMALAIADQACK